MNLYREYILRVPLEVEAERYEYINERATAFLGYPIPFTAGVVVGFLAGFLSWLIRNRL